MVCCGLGFTLDWGFAGTGLSKSGQPGNRLEPSLTGNPVRSGTRMAFNQSVARLAIGLLAAASPVPL